MGKATSPRRREPHKNKNEKQISRKCVTMGQERWRMQLGGDNIVCEGDNNTTMREGKKAWMGGDDVVCEGDDNTCAFLHCTTKDLTI